MNVLWTNGALRIVDLGGENMVEEYFYSTSTHKDGGYWHRMSDVYGGRNAIRDLRSQVDALLAGQKNMHAATEAALSAADAVAALIDHPVHLDEHARGVMAAYRAARKLCPPCPRRW